MKYKNIKIDEARVSEMSFRNKESAQFAVARSMAYLTDSEKAKRLSQNRCSYCFYMNGSKLAGQAFTEYNCGVCDKDLMHPNTAVPVACEDCAKKHCLCVDCGADLHLRSGRKSTL